MAPPPAEGESRAPASVGSAESDGRRLRRMVDAHFDLVWRTVRFLGVSEANAEDVAQQAFCVLAQRLPGIAAGAERSFLLTTAWRVASEHRRTARRRPATSEGEVDELAAALPSPDELVDQKRARGVLQEVLDAMPEDLRLVFVLYEIEELTLPEIASATGVRLGTATSRLRRARESFQSTLKRRKASARPTGGAR